MSALDFNTFFIFVIVHGFLQFYLQLAIKLSIFFNFTYDFNQLSPYNSMSFSKWSLIVNFFNLAFN